MKLRIDDAPNVLCSLHIADLDTRGRRQHSVAITGWIACLGKLPVSITVLSKGLRIAATELRSLDFLSAEARPTLPDGWQRQDVHFRFSLAPLTGPFEAELHLSCATSTGAPAGEICIGALTGARPAVMSTALRLPILLPALGRSGTTLMMSLLGKHPQIIVPGAYPFETREASYWWHTARVLTSPANHEFSMGPDAFDEAHFFRTGFNPYAHRQYEKSICRGAYADWVDDAGVEEVREFVRRRVDRFIDFASIDQGKHSARYFAEKMLVSSLTDFVNGMYDAPPIIYLVRDLRDSFLSAKAFNSARGTSSFGFAGRTEAEVVEARRRIASILVEAKRSNDAGRALFVRYEDLVLRTRDTMRDVLSYLSLPPDDQALDMIAEALPDDAFARHATSNSAQASVFRWREQMSAVEQADFSEQFEDYLNCFEYPLA